MNLWVWSKQQNINSRSKRVDCQRCYREVYAKWLRNYMGVTALGDSSTDAQGTAAMTLEGWHS